MKIKFWKGNGSGWRAGELEVAGGLESCLVKASPAKNSLDLTAEGAKTTKEGNFCPRNTRKDAKLKGRNWPTGENNGDFNEKLNIQHSTSNIQKTEPCGMVTVSGQVRQGFALTFQNGRLASVAES